MNPNNDEQLTPSTIAGRFIDSYTTSLHPQLAPLINKVAKDHILLLSKRDHKQQVTQRLIDDDDLLPRSARFHFKLTFPEKLDTRPEFIALRTEANEITSKYSKELKKLIIKAAQLEITTMNEDIRLHIVKSLRLITQLTMLIDHDTTSQDSKTYQLITHYLPILTTNAPMTKQEFCELYKQVHKLNTYPPTNTDNVATNPIFDVDHSDSMFFTQISEVQQQLTPAPPADLDKLKDIIEAIFVTTWQRYSAQQQENKIAYELKKITTAYLTEEATENAVLDVDSEPPADKRELKALIRQEAKAETKELANKIDQLSNLFEQQFGTKNYQPRGHGGASDNQPNTPASTTPATDQRKKPPASILHIRKHNSPKPKTPGNYTPYHRSGYDSRPAQTTPIGHPLFTPPLTATPTAARGSNNNNYHQSNSHINTPTLYQQHTPPPTASRTVTFGITPSHKRNYAQVDDNNDDSKPAAKNSRPSYGTKTSNKKKQNYNNKRNTP
jgi:hypothetical protein